MNYFSIKDIERMSGIKAHTLRIWEQRHGLRFCKRKESFHRYYDNDDLKKILRIAYLYHHGYKISRIATMSEDEVKSLSTISLGENSYDIFINQMIEASIDYDQPRFERIIHNALLHLGFEKTVVSVFYPFMEKIGVLWISDHVIPAQEHFSSNLIQKKIIMATDGLENTLTDDGTVIVVYSPEGELHEIPLLVMQYILKKQGVRTVYFGCNIAVRELDYYCQHRPVSHLYFHLITNFIHKEPEEYLGCLREKFAGKKIIASGPALRDVVVPGVRIMRSLKEMLDISAVLGEKL